jgi:hypothetical protein
MNTSRYAEDPHLCAFRLKHCTDDRTVHVFGCCFGLGFSETHSLDMPMAVVRANGFIRGSGILDRVSRVTCSTLSRWHRHVTVINATRDASRVRFIKQPRSVSRAYLQASVTPLCECGACSNHARFTCSMVPRQGTAWTQRLAPLGAHRAYRDVAQ